MEKHDDQGGEVLDGPPDEMAPEPEGEGIEEGLEPNEHGTLPVGG